LRERTLDQLETIFGVGDIRGRIRAEKHITPNDWAAEGIQYGATFNLAHTLGQMLHKRPQHKMRGVEGTWFVGGGTHPGSGLPVIFLSSQITARLLCAELGLNCALGAAVMRPYIEELSKVAGDTLNSCYPNAGLPNPMSETGFDETPDVTGSMLAEFAAAGFVNLVGGCCGTTPEHIAEIARRVAAYRPRGLSDPLFSGLVSDLSAA
jgi:hypothetical protein